LAGLAEEKILVYFMSIWSILLPFGIFCGHLIYFVVVWYILWSFGIFLTVLVCCAKKNLATLRLINIWLSDGADLEIKNKYFSHFERRRSIDNDKRASV
jgi:hypothetical protein